MAVNCWNGSCTPACFQTSWSGRDGLVTSRTRKDALLLVFTVGTRVEPVAASRGALEVLHEELWI